MDTLKMKRYTILLPLLILSPLSLYAEQEPPAADVSEVVTFTEQRSALMAGEERDEWMLSMKEKLSMATREVGPFGLPQDLSKAAIKIIESVAPEQGKEIKDGTESDLQTFAKTVAAIKVNVMNTSNGDFFIGSRKFQVGDVFPLSKNGESYQTQVVSVTDSNITFQNTKNGEHALIKFNEPPAGIRSASSTRTLKGIRPYRASNLTPLNLD